MEYSSDISFQKPQILCLLGDLQVEANLHEEALATYRHIINRLDSCCTEARLSLGNLLRRLGDEKAALEVLEPSLLRSSHESEEGDKPSLSEEEDDDEEEESSSESSESDAGFSDSEANDASGDENDSENAEAEAQASEAVDGSNRLVNTSGMLCNDPNAMRLAYERCKLLDSPNTIDKFLQEACRLLFGDVMQVYSCERPGRKSMASYLNFLVNMIFHFFCLYFSCRDVPVLPLQASLGPSACSSR